MTPALLLSGAARETCRARPAAAGGARKQDSCSQQHGCSQAAPAARRCHLCLLWGCSRSFPACGAQQWCPTRGSTPPGPAPMLCEPPAVFTHGRKQGRVAEGSWLQLYPSQPALLHWGHGDKEGLLHCMERSAGAGESGNKMYNKIKNCFPPRQLRSAMKPPFRHNQP